MRFLTGDIGGTKSRLALAESVRGNLRLSNEKTYLSADFSGLEEILLRYLQTLGQPVDGAALGLPGPVTGGRCEVTNLPWSVDASSLKENVHLPQVELVNDLEATAWGIGALTDSDILTLQPGNIDSRGNCSIIAAGTGLGQAGMFWDGSRHTPFPSEGGHADFSPGNDLEVELFNWLRGKYGKVCWEQVVSGPGLVDIFRFLSEFWKTPVPAVLEEAMSRGDPAAAISTAATSGASKTCKESMLLFARLYGAEAGNQALKLMAIGGVYIGGGIAPKIIQWLQHPSFLEAFNDKGKMRRLMEGMPVRVILNDRAALLGPAMKYLPALA